MNRKISVVVTLAFFLALGAVFYFEAQKISGAVPSSWTQDTKADCAVVLTGGAGRIREGIDLLAQGQIRKLIISGVNPQAQIHEIFPLAPYYPSVKPEDIILERRSTTTYGNVHQSLPLLEAVRCRSVVLVTSHFHMYRAKRTFEGASQQYKFIERGVVSGSLRPDMTELLIETTKSLFYSLWAY